MHHLTVFVCTVHRNRGRRGAIRFHFLRSLSFIHGFIASKASCCGEATKRTAAAKNLFVRFQRDPWIMCWISFLTHRISYIRLASRWDCRPRRHGVGKDLYFVVLSSLHCRLLLRSPIRTKGHSRRRGVTVNRLYCISIPASVLPFGPFSTWSYHDGRGHWSHLVRDRRPNKSCFGVFSIFESCFVTMWQNAFSMGALGYKCPAWAFDPVFQMIDYWDNLRDF